MTEVLGFDTVTMACIVWLTLTRVFDTESVALNVVLPTESTAELTSNVAHTNANASISTQPIR